MTKTEAYRIFGLSMNQPLTLEQIKNRYRILTKTYHPDNPKTGSEDMMARINLAFDALRTYNFEPEDNTENQPFPKTRKEAVDDDFNPDFTPFEYGARDESFYHNPDYRKKEESKKNYEQYGQYYEEAYNTTQDYNEDNEEAYYENEEEASKDTKNKKHGGAFIILKIIGSFFKFIIVLGIIGFIAAIPASLYLFGMNQKGIFVACAALSLAVLSVLVYRFFNELIS